MSFTVADMVRQHASATPDAPALTFEGRTWSFAGLDARSSQSAQALRGAGVSAGDRVALLTRNRDECYELIAACSKLGAILVGLNWRLAPQELQAIIADAQPTVIVVGPTEQELLNEAARATASVRRTVTLGEEFDAWRDRKSVV